MTSRRTALKVGHAMIGLEPFEASELDSFAWREFPSADLRHRGGRQDVTCWPCRWNGAVWYGLLTFM